MAICQSPALAARIIRGARPPSGAADRALAVGIFGSARASRAVFGALAEHIRCSIVGACRPGIRGWIKSIRPICPICPIKPSPFPPGTDSDSEYRFFVSAFSIYNSSFLREFPSFSLTKYRQIQPALAKYRLSPGKKRFYFIFAFRFSDAIFHPQSSIFNPPPSRHPNGIQIIPFASLCQAMSAYANHPPGGLPSTIRPFAT
jgi:hypothetical protein